MRRGTLIHRTLSALALPALIGLSGTLHAEPSGRLVYDAGPSSASCPDEAGMRTAVRARLGEDPFTDSSAATRTFALSIEARGELLVGSVELKNEDGSSAGRRTVNGKAGACNELVEALALSVSLAINPDLVVESRASATPEPLPPPPAAPPAEPAQATVAAESPAIAIVAPKPVTHAPAQTTPRDSSVHETNDRGAVDENRATGVGAMTGAFVHGAIGTGPGTAAGGSVMIRPRTSSGPSSGRRLHPEFSVGLEGRFDGFTQESLPGGGTVKSNLAASVITLCAHLGPIFGCPAFMAGMLFAHSENVETEASDFGPYVAAGGRLGAEFPLSEHLRLEARLDVLAPLAPVTIAFNGTTVWTAGTSGTLGVGVVAQLP